MTVQTLAIIVLLVSFFVMIFLRFPIAYAVGLSSVLCMMVQGQALTDVCRLMVKGISSFSLMAVPFFITMGVLMGSGGISEKLIALADACVGWMRGGMAMVNIVASYFFGGISGSASADTASIGSIMIPMMVDQGYDADFSTAVTITSSCEGLLVPPSHNMVIYATTAGGISVGSLFLAGYLPGIWLGRGGVPGGGLCGSGNLHWHHWLGGALPPALPQVFHRFCRQCGKRGQDRRCADPQRRNLLPGPGCQQPVMPVDLRRRGGQSAAKLPAGGAAHRPLPQRRGAGLVGSGNTRRRNG